MGMRKIGGLLSIAAIVATVAEPVMAQCSMQSQMQAAQQAEQQRRLLAIQANMATLALLNKLQTACMQGFQMIPTENLPDGSIVFSVLTSIEQSACKGLADQVRNTAQSGMAAAQAAAQQQIDNIAASVSKAAGGGGLLAPAQSTSSSSSSGWGSAVANAMSRIFQ
ncbi:hypothetical protein [Trinickia dinghuensis]|uniref:Uncharacterized protein n=1 Tax=Trinickia dinghuensis TaxID=2291023 RepID=A0A3D8K0I0_9BURK|nr:hypothetical protein [Trinickia dinghuensis]RDU98759.1 hypothetical protein DWV00_10850 [Trinickia dinghuensis]